MSVQNSNNPICRRTGPLLSEYVDNTLSAREMWEVEKHLAECRDCTMQAQQLKQTVEALRSAESFDTSDTFMAKLHARLDDLGPIPERRSLAAALREWWMEARKHLNTRPIPTLSFGMATFILAALLFGGPHVTAPNSPNTPAEVVSQDALDRHVAVTASDPFDDPVAAKLEAASSVADNGAHGTD